MNKGTMKLMVCVGLAMVTVLWGAPFADSEGQPEKAQAIRLVSHPSSLEGKTVLLRWNGKMSGDKLLIRIGELLIEQVKGVKVVKMWEIDKSTADVSKNAEESAAIAGKIAAMRPDLVIASQAD